MEKSRGKKSGIIVISQENFEEQLIQNAICKQENRHLLLFFFHNLFGYDIHHFVTSLTRKKGRIKCIPNNEEKNISLSLTIPVGKKINSKGGIKKNIS